MPHARSAAVALLCALLAVCASGCEARDDVPPSAPSSPSPEPSSPTAAHPEVARYLEWARKKAKRAQAAERRS